MSFYKTIVFVICLFISTSSWSEVIVLHSGQRIEGKILYQDKQCIRVDVGLQSEITYYFDEIKQILPDPPKPLKKKKTPSKDQPTKSKADELEQQAIEMIDANKMEEGIALIQKAVEIEPTPMRHMNYGSILFGNGVTQFQEGHKAQAAIIFHKAEQELSQAIAGFNPKKEGVFLSQAYFLLGEMYLNAYVDKDQARTFYQKALSHYDNESVKAALAKLE